MTEPALATPSREECPVPVLLWMRLVPEVAGKRVLHVSSAHSSAIIQALFRQSQMPVCCVGGKEADFPGGAVEFHSSIESVPPGSHDLAIVDTRQLLGDSMGPGMALRDKVKKIVDRMRPQGYVLFSFPAGVSGMLDRCRLLRSLHHQSFEILRYFLCDPNVEDAEAILPLTGNRSWAATFISSSDSRRRGARTLLARWTKRFALRCLGKFYPFQALLVEGRKPESTEAQPATTNFDRLPALAAKALGSQQLSVAILRSRPFSGKQFLFLRELDTSEFAAVACLCDAQSPAAPLLQQAGKNLALLSGLSERLARVRIGIPKALHFDRSGTSTVLLTTAANGKPLAKMLKESRRAVAVPAIEHLGPEIMRLLIALHGELNGSLQQEVDYFGNQYLENYLGIKIDSRFLTQKFPTSCPQVQHGDLTAENIFFEETRHTWDVIDWEWLGGGYPPLFDLFSLIRSIGLTQGPSATRDWRGDALASFVRTFFSQSPVASFLRKCANHYCYHFKMDAGLTYEYFKLFLLWRCNRYRLNGAAWQGALNVWQDMLKYAASHSQEFALK